MKEELINRFIEAATRPLEEDPPVRDEAQGELMGRLDHAAKGREKEVEEATERLEKSTPDRWLGKVIAASITFILLTALASYFANVSLQEVAIRSDTNMFHPSAFKEDAALTPQQRDSKRYLAEDPLMGAWDLEELWKAHPDDPVVFAQYSKNFLDSHLKAPPDYREIWQRIDPGNGAWPLQEAAKKMESAIDLAGTRTVRDEHAFGEGLKLLEEAASAPIIRFRAPEMMVRYMELFQEPKTVIGQMRAISLSPSLLYFGAGADSHALSLAFSIQAKRLETAKDQDGLRRLIEIWGKVAAGYVTSASSESDMRNAEALLDATHEMVDVTDRMGMVPQKERLVKQQDAINATRHPSGFGKPSSGMGMLARLSTFNYREFPDPSVFEPGRKAEYALLDQLTTYLAIMVLLGVLLVVIIESVRRGKRLNGMASGLAPLFHASDTLWIFGLGVLAPLAWYLGISWLTPLGCRDLSMADLPVPPLLIQFLAAYLLVSVMLVQTILWRISRRAGFLAMGSRRLVVGWLTAFLCAAVIPLTGTARWMSGNTDDFLLAMFLACGIPALWLLWQGGAVVFSPAAGALRGLLLVRKMVGPLVALIGFLVVCEPLLHACELRWLARDTLSRADFSRGGIPKLQLEEVDRKVASYLEALGTTPP